MTSNEKEVERLLREGRDVERVLNSESVAGPSAYLSTELSKLTGQTMATYVRVMNAALAAAKKAGVTDPQAFVDKLLGDDHLRVAGEDTAVVMVLHPQVSQDTGKPLRKPIEKWISIERGIAMLVDPEGPPAQVARIRRDFAEQEIADAREMRRMDHEFREENRRKAHTDEITQRWSKAPMAQACIALVRSGKHAASRELLIDLARAFFAAESTPPTLSYCPDEAATLLGPQKFTPNKFEG